MGTIKYILNTDPFCAIITFLIVIIVLAFVADRYIRISVNKAVKRFFETLVLILFLASCCPKLPFHKVVLVDITKELGSDEVIYTCFSLDSVYKIDFKHSFKEHVNGDTLYIRPDKNGNIRIMQTK